MFVRGVATSMTKRPPVVDPGGNTVPGATRTAPGGAPTSDPTKMGTPWKSKTPGSGLTAPAIDGGTGPGSTAHAAPVSSRPHSYADTTDGDALGRPPPGNLPPPRSRAVALT